MVRQAHHERHCSAVECGYKIKKNALEAIREGKSNTLRFKKRPQCGLLIENSRGEVLLQLRDDKPSIPYPNCWGTFGGQIEEGELPEAAMMREIEEELCYLPDNPEQYGKFHNDGYDIFMFRCVDSGLRLDGMQVCEGQRAGFFSCADLDSAPFAFNCREILQDYFKRFHPEHTVFIGLGSNMGNREELLKKALERIKKLMPIQTVSSVYETEPVGYEAQDWFLNMVIQGTTRLFPELLLERLQTIETGLGRQRDIANGPRTIDLDILFYGDAVISNGQLTVPHPRLHERGFVLEPLAEIAAGFVHPVLHTSIATLLAQAGNGKRVIKKEKKKAL
jgi:2-amino-4-hydroxy-6-hydroxymethyldihydropteridine diphosphokinase